MWAGSRNYLRMRGEYWGPVQHGDDVMELPPHARRIQPAPWPATLSNGTTSACAENTLGFIGDDGVYRNYLRMRGEYAPARPLGIFWPELPPHARRILRERYTALRDQGTTSACAENTGGW